jgi:outer membrane protein
MKMLRCSAPRLTQLFFALTLVATPQLGHASAAANEPKIGYVDMARALNDVEDGKAAKAKLKVDFEAKQQKLDKMQNDLRDKKEAFDKRVAMMKPEARQEKEAELQRAMMEVQQTYMQLQQELMESETQLGQSIRKKLQAVIDKVGDKENYFLILNTGDTVLYNKRHMDLTDDLIREYNKTYTKK